MAPETSRTIKRESTVSFATNVEVPARKQGLFLVLGP